MAWTTPANYGVGEVLAASKLSTHVRDNLRYLKGLDGPFVLDAAPRVENALPSYYWKDADGGSNAKVWRMYADSNTFVLDALNDAESASSPVFTATRSGGTVTGFAFGANVPVTVADRSKIRSGPSGSAGWFYETAGGTARAFVGLDDSTDTDWRVYSSALAANIATFSTTTGVLTLHHGLVMQVGTQITSNSGALTLSGANQLILGTSAGNVITTIHLVPNVDNTLTLGVNGTRWAAVWAANGSIQTSSRATKAVLSEVEPAGAMAALRGLPVYRFHYLRGDGTADTDYTHTGPMAEDMPAGMMVQPGAVSGQSTAGYLTAALQDVDARTLDLERRLALLEAGAA